MTKPLHHLGTWDFSPAQQVGIDCENPPKVGKDFPERADFMSHQARDNQVFSVKRDDLSRYMLDLSHDNRILPFRGLK